MPAGCIVTAGVTGCGGAACACETCVCNEDNYCCTFEWDNSCVLRCSASCGQDCPCVQDCAGKTCGDDGCGGACGTCTTGMTCDAMGRCVSDPPVETAGDEATTETVTTSDGVADATTDPTSADATIQDEGTTGTATGNDVEQDDATAVTPEGTTGGGGGSGCNAGTGASASPFALVLSSFVAAIQRRSD